MRQTQTLLLASGSPRRAELLRQVGIRFEVAVADVDESRLDGESPQAYVQRLAGEKAAAGQPLALSTMPVLGADTVVLLDGEILGKPGDLDEAARMLQSLSGKEHRVLSAVVLMMPDGRAHAALNTTRVRFGVMPPAFVDCLCRTEPLLDKAGAYAIQGAAGQFVEHIDGSYSSVMGLPLFETCSLLRAGGILG